MQDLINWATLRLEALGFGGYWVIALIVYLETIIVVGQCVPGGLILAFAGFLCYLQVFDFGDMLAAVFLAHFAGEITNYTLGRVKGRALFSEDSRWLKPALLEAAERRFVGGGARIIFISQFTGVFRSLIPFTAGATRYSFLRFLPPIAVGALVWALTHLGVGFLCGASWRQAADYMEGLSLFVLVALIVLLFSGWLIRRLAQHAGELGIWLEATSRAIHRSTRYQAIANRSPRVFRFLEGRLSLTRPWGIMASLGWLATVVLLVLFALLLRDVHAEDTWRFFDLSIVNLLSQLRRPVADKLFLFITNLGSAPVVLFVTLMAGAMCLRARQAKSAVVIIGSVLLALVLSQVIKAVYARSRPEAALAMVRVPGYSFPSGHATVAVALFASLCYWLWNHPGRIRLRMGLAGFVLALVILIGFSRLYLGVHFPSDVLAGFLLGSACVVFLATIARNVAVLPDLQRRADLRALAVILAQLAFTWYIYSHQPAGPRPRVYRPGTGRTVETTSSLVKKVPREARGLSGQLSVPVDAVMVGDKYRFRDHLIGVGWEEVPSGAFFTSQVNAPLFPTFIEGVPAEMTLQRRTESERMVVRLWRLDFYLDQRQTWAISVVGEERKPKLLGLTVFRTIPDLDLTLSAFAQDVRGLGVEVLPEFRKRGLYSWKRPFFTHGTGIFIDLRETTSSAVHELE